MNILEKIVLHKQKEVSIRQKDRSLSILAQSMYYKADCLSMVESLNRDDKSGIIAEFKRRSPSKPSINLTADVADVTIGYQEAGVSGLSVLTDEFFFGGNNLDLTTARKSNNCPILRKDFVVDAYQIHEAKSIGADLILLIAEILTKEEVSILARTAKDLGLEVLMEIHSEKQLEKLCDQVDIVGVNNRNLDTFEVNIQNSLELTSAIPSSVVKISESGISDVQSILQLKAVGFQGFLIGEHFMISDDPAAQCKHFINNIKTSRIDKIIVNP